MFDFFNKLLGTKTEAEPATKATPARTYQDVIGHLNGTRVDTKIKVNRTGSGKYGYRKFTFVFKLPGSNISHTEESDVDETNVRHDNGLPSGKIQVETTFDKNFLEREVPAEGIDWDEVYNYCYVNFFANENTADNLFL